MARQLKPTYHPERQAEVKGLSDAYDAILNAMKSRGGYIRDTYQAAKRRRLAMVADAISEAMAETLQP